MKVYLPNDSKIDIGGGWTFRSNFIKYAPSADIKIVYNPDNADIVLIPAATMVTRETVAQLVKPFVLRVDGYPEEWRNRGSGINRLLEFAKASQGIVYQSLFTKSFVGSFIEQKGITKPFYIIYNGVDKKIFRPDGEKIDKDAKRVFVTTFFRKDPNKRFEEVMYRYRMEWLKDKDISLWLIGRFPTEYAQWNYGFYNGERVKNWGIIKSDEQKAMILRSADEFWFPSFADPCPNSLIEAIACGTKPMYLDDFGASRELISAITGGWDYDAVTMVRKYKEFFEIVLNNNVKK